MSELTLKVKQNPGVIELNFDELEKAIDQKLAEYKGAVFTEETKDIAKAEVSSLRKQKKELDDIRKTIKNEWMKPYEDFEKRVKTLLVKYDEPINLINDQVKDFEKKRKAEKREKIKVLYKEQIGDLGDFLPLSKIYDPRWENVTTTMKSIKESITTYVSSAESAIEQIKAMQSEKEHDALNVYKNTLDLAKALSVITEYERQKAEILRREEEKRRAEEERKHQQEIERIRREERERIAREEQIRRDAEALAMEDLEEKMKRDSAEAAADIKTEEPEDDVLPFVQPDTKTVFYRVVATDEELEQVEMAFNSIGIYFERRDA